MHIKYKHDAAVPRGLILCAAGWPSVFQGENVRVHMAVSDDTDPAHTWHSTAKLLNQR